MSISTTATSVSYAAGTVSCPVPFPFMNPTDLVVVVNGVVKVINSDYTVAGGGDSTGTVTLLVAATGTGVVISRTTPLTQPTDFRSQGQFFPKLHEMALDRLTMLAQEEPAARIAGDAASAALVDAEAVLRAAADAAEAAARAAADAAIIASGAMPANVGIAPVVAYGDTEIRTVAAWASSLVRVRSPLQDGADPTGVADSTTAIQATLTALGTAGGGVCLLPAGMFKITDTLLVPSKVVIRGAGRGATRLISPSGAYPGKTVEGQKVYATVAMAAVDQAGCFDLTVDHTAGPSANGISIVAGNSGAGTRSTNCRIDGCEVLFANTSGHAYCIWNLKSDHSKITNNWVDGGFTTYVWTAGNPQEGIESFGGEDVLIQGNTVQNVQANAIYVTSDAVTGAVRNVRVIGNYVEKAGRGITITPLTAQDILVANNQIHTAWDGGIYITASATTNTENLSILGNTISDVGDADVHAAGTGIHIYGDLAGTLRNTLIAGNQIRDTEGATTAGIALYLYSGVRILRNMIRNSAGFGILAYQADNLVIDGNCTDVTVDSAIIVSNGGSAHTPANCRVTGNDCRNYNGGSAAQAGIFLAPASNCVVEDNTLLHANSCYPIYCSAGDKVFIGAGNRLLMSYAGNPVFRNDGTNPNRGSYALTGTDKANGYAIITNTQMHQSATVVVRQSDPSTSNNPWPPTNAPIQFPFVVQIGATAIVLRFAIGVGDATFTYTIL